MGISTCGSGEGTHGFSSVRTHISTLFGQSLLGFAMEKLNINNK